jgi:hypothetical protein
MKSNGKGALAALACVGLIMGAFAGPVSAAKPKSAPLEGEGSGLEIVANVSYTGGTDMEWARIKGRDYAFAANSPSYSGGEPAGLHVIDITSPEKPKEVAFLNCALNQGDVQVSWNKKYVYLAADSTGGPDACLGIGKLGFLIIDVKNPLKPKAVGFAEIPKGSHNITAHPTKPYVYNSDSELASAGEIQIWNVKNPKKPELVNAVRSVPHSPHDISFNKDGSMAVTAAVSHIDLWDTSDPENPTILFETQCPGCSITHDAKFTPDSTGIIVGDEGGGGGTYPCPGGALYFYSIQGGQVLVPQGVYEPEVLLMARDAPDSCTSHVMELSDDGKTLAISWYSAGTRYLDISAMSGAAIGPNSSGGVTELGWFMPVDGVSWSSKFLNSDGKYIFSNDMARGFDVFKITD